MMRFYGNGAVWDVEKSKKLCEFTKGIKGNKGYLDTKDNRTIGILLKLNYEHDENVVAEIENAEEEIIYEELTEEELREEGKRLGINSYWNKNIEKLKAEIAEKEGV